MILARKYEEEQKKFSSKVELKGEIQKNPLLCGVECYLQGKDILACALLWDPLSGKIVEIAYSSGPSSLPMNSEFSAYREGKMMGEAVVSLSKKPDVILVNGEGVMHPRRFGIASHLGVFLDIASIGVSKELPFGEVKGDFVVHCGEKIGKVVKTRVHANPIYVSVGHKISLEDAALIAKSSVREPHKMPEPLHLAHKYAKKKYKELHP